jgi:glycine cleavage system H protein
LKAGETFGVVESVKAASDVYMPVSGTVTEVNATLNTAPETLNTAPYDAGWILKVKASNLAEADALLSPEDYAKLNG